MNDGISKWGIDTQIATRTVQLWVQNDDLLYERAREAAFEGTTFDPSEHYPSHPREWGDFIDEAGGLIEDYVKDTINPDESDGLVGEILHDYLDSVDWRQIADSILDPNDYTGDESEDDDDDDDDDA